MGDDVDGWGAAKLGVKAPCAERILIEGACAERIEGIDLVEVRAICCCTVAIVKSGILQLRLGKFAL